MKNPLNFFSYLKQHGWKKTKSEWYKNYLLLDTPEQLLKKEIAGYVGTMGALLLALVILAMQGMWYISLVFVFSIWIAYIQFKGKLKQLKILNDMTEKFTEEKNEQE